MQFFAAGKQYAVIDLTVNKFEVPFLYSSYILQYGGNIEQCAILSDHWHHFGECNLIAFDCQVYKYFLSYFT